MEKLRQSQAFLRKRKMMLVLPLLVIPFLTMGFWALGGGRNQQTGTKPQMQGLNLNLPDANLKDDGMADKLSFYDKADKDSVKRGEYMRSDPYYKAGKDTVGPSANQLEGMVNHTAAKYNQRLNPSPYEPSHNDAEQKLMQKLAMLEQELNKPKDKVGSANTENEKAAQSDDFSEHVNRLEVMMQGMSTGKTEDPEMQQLGNTLDKILDIQHPDRVKDRIKEKSVKQKGQVFTVQSSFVPNNIGLIETAQKQNGTPIGFYSIDDPNQTMTEDNAIEAVVSGTQNLINGAILQLRLATDVYINGILIPRGNPINGVVTLNNERLQAEITSIRYGKSLLPVSLNIFDLDGLPGIYIPGAISREVAKNAAENNLQLLDMALLDPSLKAQVATAGISTAKNLLSRKIKQVKVTVKAGYKVLLKSKDVQQ